MLLSSISILSINFKSKFLSIFFSKITEKDNLIQSLYEDKVKGIYIIASSRQIYNLYFGFIRIRL